MKHISYTSSALVYSMSTIFCIAILFGLKVGWDSMPPFAHQIWGMIVFYAIGGMILVIFASIAWMFVSKGHSQWKLDHQGVKEVRKRVVKSEN